MTHVEFGGPLPPPPNSAYPKNQKCLKWPKNDPGWFSPCWVTPPLTQHVNIPADGDYTKRVVTPFGTTCLKIFLVMTHVELGGGVTQHTQKTKNA